MPQGQSVGSEGLGFGTFQPPVGMPRKPGFGFRVDNICPVPGPATELCSLVIVVGLDDFLTSVHHERTVLRHRLTDGHRLQQQQPGGGVICLDNSCAGRCLRISDTVGHVVSVDDRRRVVTVDVKDPTCVAARRGREFQPGHVGRDLASTPQRPTPSATPTNSTALQEVRCPRTDRR